MKRCPYNLISSILFIVMFLLIKTVNGQNLILIEGKVANAKGELIQNAHVINLSQKQGTITDINGIFRIIAAANDSVLITSIGYKHYRAKVPNEILNKILMINIVLIEDTITLKEAIIRRYPPTFQLFKKEFIALKLEDEKKLAIFDKIDEKQFDSKGGISLPGPFSLLYNIFSKEAKSKRKLADLVQVDKIRGILYKKIPKENLIKRYNFKNEIELIVFIDFCKIPEKMIVNNSAYDILVYFNNCYAVYISK